MKRNEYKNIMEGGVGRLALIGYICIGLQTRK
jgi:hypothetical protein